MINLIIWLMVGGVVGWIASLLVKTNGSGVNIVVGVIGAAIGGFMMRVIGWDDENVTQTISASSVAASLAGAVFLLGVINFLGDRRVRT